MNISTSQYCTSLPQCDVPSFCDRNMAAMQGIKLKCNICCIGPYVFVWSTFPSQIFFPPKVQNDYIRLHYCGFNA